MVKLACPAEPVRSNCPAFASHAGATGCPIKRADLARRRHACIRPPVPTGRSDRRKPPEPEVIRRWGTLGKGALPGLASKLLQCNTPGDEVLAATRPPIDACVKGQSQASIAARRSIACLAGKPCSTGLPTGKAKDAVRHSWVGTLSLTTCRLNGASQKVGPVHDGHKHPLRIKPICHGESSAVRVARYWQSACQQGNPVKSWREG